jgi:ssDNA-binding Zn-finger/Zn-ribbon topoisomerase 1
MTNWSLPDEFDGWYLEQKLKDAEDSMRIESQTRSEQATCPRCGSEVVRATFGKSSGNTACSCALASR